MLHHSSLPVGATNTCTACCMAKLLLLHECAGQVSHPALLCLSACFTLHGMACDNAFEQQCLGRVVSDYL